MGRENFNLENNETNGEKKSISSIIKEILKIGTILTILMIIVNFMDIKEKLDNVDLDIFIAENLMNSYEEAYNYALSVKYDKYDKENDEKKKSEIKEDAMKGFKEILSQELYNDIEKHIFDSNMYDDLDKTEYQFEYTHNENGNLILSVDNEDDTIKIENPYYYRIDRHKKTRSKPINTDSRIYKVKRKSLGSNQYILSERIDTSKGTQ